MQLFKKLVKFSCSNFQFTSKITYLYISFVSFVFFHLFFFKTSHHILPFVICAIFLFFFLPWIDCHSVSLSLSLSMPLILPLCCSLVHAGTHPRIPNESTLCLPSFIGTLIIALVIAWFRLHYFEERLLSRMLPNCLRSLPFMMHGFNNSVSIDRLRFIADHRHVVVHVVRGFRNQFGRSTLIKERSIREIFTRKNKMK